MPNPSEMLGVSPDASETEIRNRYLQLVREFPPDRAPERFAEIRAAFDELGNPSIQLERRLFSLATRDSLEDLQADLCTAENRQVVHNRGAGPGGIAMTDSENDERILDLFRHWLQETRQEAAEANERANGVTAPLPRFGFDRIVEEFTALRHELKLQTRSSRALEERVEASLTTLADATSLFRSATDKETTVTSVKPPTRISP